MAVCVGNDEYLLPGALLPPEGFDHSMPTVVSELRKWTAPDTAECYVSATGKVFGPFLRDPDQCWLEMVVDDGRVLWFKSGANYSQ